MEKNVINFRSVGDVIKRLGELQEDAIYGEKTNIRLHLHSGSLNRDLKIVGMYLDFSSSKEEITIDVTFESKLIVIVK